MKQDILAPDFLKKYETKQQEEIVSVPTGLPTLNRICRDDGGGGGFAQGWFSQWPATQDSGNPHWR